MKRPVKLPTQLESAIRSSSTPPVSACSPFNQPRGARANRLSVTPAVIKSAHLSPTPSARWLILLYALNEGRRRVAGAPYDAIGGAAPSVGRLSRAARFLVALAPPT